MNETEIVRFLRDHGGKVTNTELYLNFKQFIRTADDKRNFPELVNKVAFVKKKDVDGKEVKYTYLRKGYKTGPLPVSQEVINEEPKTEKARHRQSSPVRAPSPPTISPTIDQKHLDIDPRLAKHRQLILQHNQRVPSLESLNSAKENIGISIDPNSNRSSREPSPQQPIKEEPFKKPIIPVAMKKPLKLSNSNMNSNIRELSGSCDTISSTGAESTASRESHRTRIDETEKSWIRAITKNDYKKVQQMLEERVDLLDYRDYICGYTGAHWAVKKNHSKILKMFLAAGLNPNVTSNNGGTLLHLAIQSGHFEIVKELTSMREHSRLLVDIRARDNAGKLPRHYIDEDKFEPEEIEYMRRIIEPPRQDLPDVVDNAFKDRRNRKASSKSEFDSALSIDEHPMDLSKSKKQKKIGKSIKKGLSKSIGRLPTFSKERPEKYSKLQKSKISSPVTSPNVSRGPSLENICDI